MCSSDLKGTLEATTIAASDASADNYALNGKAFVWVKYAIAIGANKCWLQIGEEAAKSRGNTRSIVGGDATGIESIHNSQFTIDKACASERDVSLLTNRPASAAELKTEFNSQLTIQDPEIKNQKSEIVLHPCVEINLRLNMGIIAHEVRRKLLASGTEGTFHVTAFPTEEAAQQFHQEQTTKYPPVYREGKIVSGYHPLTPILPHTRHHAYVVCEAKR